MIDILSCYICAIAVTYVLYRICFSKKKSEFSREVEIKEGNIDMRFHSTVSFDFPNVQSEYDLRYTDVGHSLNEEISELEVTEYCKF